MPHVRRSALAAARARYCIFHHRQRANKLARDRYHRPSVTDNVRRYSKQTYHTYPRVKQQCKRSSNATEQTPEKKSCRKSFKAKQRASTSLQSVDIMAAISTFRTNKAKLCEYPFAMCNRLFWKDGVSVLQFATNITNNYKEQLTHVQHNDKQWLGRT